MINQVISVDRKKYAAGLFWQPVAVGFVARNYARSLARSVDRRLNLYTEYRAMVGLGSKRVGQRRGMQAAAAEVMEAFAEYTSFLAVFHTGDWYFLVAVRNGIILEDKLLPDEESARNEYARLAAIPDWGALFAPASWGMPRAVERTLADVITHNSRAVLRPISRFRAGVFSAVLIALFVLGLLVIFRGPIHEMLAPRPRIQDVDPEVVAEYQRQLEEKSRQLDEQYDIQKLPPPEPLRIPYDYLPNPIARAQQCYHAMDFVMQPVSGWNQISAECDEQHVRAIFQRQENYGTLTGFYVAAENVMPMAYVQEIGDDRIVVRAKLPNLPVQASQDERDAQTILRDVTSLFQSMNATMETAQIVTDNVTNGVESVDLNIVEIAATSKLMPVEFMRMFDEFGGVYMTRCAWDVSRRIWNYEVIIYAK